MALELTVTYWHSPIETEFGIFQPPSYALADIGSCLDGKRNCLISYCQERGECPTMFLYVQKSAVVHRGIQGYPDHWQIAFQSGIQAIPPAYIQIPVKERRATTGKTPYPDGSKPADIPEPDTSSSDDDDQMGDIQHEPASKSDNLSCFMEDSGNYISAHPNGVFLYGDHLKQWAQNWAFRGRKGI